MLNEHVSRDLIAMRTRRFRDLCGELSIHTSNKNPVCQRLEAAERFCAASSPFGGQDLDLLSKTGEFLWLSECLEHIKGRIKGTSHVNRLVQEARYANELVELMAAWIVEKAGHPVSLDEPDVVAHVGNVRVGLACKKLDSKRKLIQRIREGRDQIQNSGMEGIIVVDVSKIVEYQTGAVARTEDDAYHALSVSTGRLWEDVERGVLAKLQGTSVGSVLFCDFQFYGIQRSIDHGAKIAHYTPFQAGYLSLRSRRNRHAAIETLEDAIMKLGLNPLSV